MAYIPLDLSKIGNRDVECLVRHGVENLLHDAHQLLATHSNDGAEAGLLPKYQFQMAISLLLLCTVGAVSSLRNFELEPFDLPDQPAGRRKRNTDRKDYVSCLADYFPWKECPFKAEGKFAAYTKHDVSAFLYSAFRCGLVHSAALHKMPFRLKFGRALRLDGKAEERVEEMERASEPPGQGFIKFNDDRAVLWADNFYWGIRLMTERYLSDPSNVQAIANHIGAQAPRP